MINRRSLIVGAAVLSAAPAIPAPAKAVTYETYSDGVWYDFSDPTTMFQDRKGTIPVKRVGDPVRRINCKRGSGPAFVQHYGVFPTWGGDHLLWKDAEYYGFNFRPITKLYLEGSKI